MSEAVFIREERLKPGTAARWAKKNLFSSPFNTVLTVLAVAFLVIALRGLVRWVFFTADWSPVTQNLRLFMIGQYPPEQAWRIATVVWLGSFLLGMTWGQVGGTAGTFAKAAALATAALALLPLAPEEMSWAARLGLLANSVLIGVGHLVGRQTVHRPRWLTVGWLLFVVAAGLLVAGINNSALLPRVDSGLWGGLLLTFMLAIVGIIASFPIGILLALGRRSNLPLVRLLCTVFIEVVRGVPLVTILFMASILLPLFLPEQIRIDRVLRAMAGMTLFASAYMAENVRGGLAAIPIGQYEAAKAVGLNPVLTMLLIILPQALRIVIPAIVGQFIALFMDTTLAVIVGLLELLAVGKAVIQGNPEWLTRQAEVYLFIAGVFWIFTFSMSFASRRLETALGVGKR